MANPDTCWHNVVRQDEPYECHCVSCGTRITKEINATKNYQYSVHSDVWVHNGEPTGRSGGIERYLERSYKPPASDTSLAILRAKLQGGDLDLRGGRVERPQAPADPGD